MKKQRYKVTLMKYVRDAASCGVDQDSHRFLFDMLVSGTGRITKRRPFASDIDQNVLKIRQIFIRLGIFSFINLDRTNTKVISLCVMTFQNME